MKQKDIVVIVGVVVISGIASYFLSNALFAAPKNRKTQVEVVEAISPDFSQPDKNYFNSSSIDPTQPITIGDNQNPTPFNSTTN